MQSNKMVYAFKTDTVWGFGVEPDNIEGIKKIYEIKKRDLKKPLILMSDSFEYLKKYIKEIPDYAYDLIEKEDVVISMTHYGYIKRIPVVEYRQQHRGGMGSTGHKPKEEDFVIKIPFNGIVKRNDDEEFEWLNSYNLLFNHTLWHQQN